MMKSLVLILILYVPSSVYVYVCMYVPKLVTIITIIIIII